MATKTDMSASALAETPSYPARKRRLSDAEIADLEKHRPLTGTKPRTVEVSDGVPLPIEENRDTVLNVPHTDPAGP